MTHPYIRIHFKTVDPTVTDDETVIPKAYERGDWWMNTVSGDVFQCKDASVGAAVWDAIGGGGAAVWGAITGTLSAQTDLQTALDAKIPTTYLDTDGTLAANSDVKLATQKAVKTFVENAVTGLLEFKGATDTSANPNYPAALKGDAYVVSVAGKIGGASGKSVDIGDFYIANADNAGGTEASVGTSWFVLEHNLLGALLAANNLSDVPNPTTARSNLGLIIGTDIQAYSAQLAAIVGLSPANDDIIQRKAGVWTNRTMAQFALDFAMSVYIAAQTTGATPDIDDVIFYRRDSDGLIRKIDFGALVNNLLAPEFGTVFASITHDHDGADSPVLSHFNFSNIGTNSHATIDTHLANTSNPHSTTAAQVGAIPTDGWEARSETWTRTGNHSFTVPGDLTAIYKKYTRVKYNDGAVEYGTVYPDPLFGGGTTTVNLIPNTTYSMAATTITGTYVSYLPKPTGFPDKFTWAPSTIPWTVGNGTVHYKFFPRADGFMEHEIYFLLGSTSAITGANYTPPAAVNHAETSSSRYPVALVTFSDVSPATSYTGVSLSIPASNVFGMRAFSIPTTYATQVTVSSTIPFTWTTSDFISIQGVPYPY